MLIQVLEITKNWYCTKQIVLPTHRMCSWLSFYLVVRVIEKRCFEDLADNRPIYRTKGGMSFHIQGSIAWKVSTFYGTFNWCWTSDEAELAFGRNASFDLQSDIIWYWIDMNQYRFMWLTFRTWRVYNIHTQFRNILSVLWFPIKMSHRRQILSLLCVCLRMCWLHFSQDIKDRGYLYDHRAAISSSVDP